MKVGYVNQKYIKNKKFKLRKIAVTLGLASAILISINLKNKNIDDVRKIYVTETNIDSFDDFETNIINSLNDYENSYNKYQNDPSIENRIDLVSETRYLSTIANNLMEQKLNEAMGTNSNINIFSRDEGERVISIDNEITDYNIPYDYNQLINDKDFVDTVYKGDGSSDAWKEQMQEFNKQGLNLYKDILKNLDTDYTFENNKFKKTEDIKTR